MSTLGGCDHTPTIRFLGAFAGAAAMLAFAALPPEPARGAPAAGTDCREVNAFVEGIPRSAVESFLPADPGDEDPYRPVQPNATAGLGEVFIDALECRSLHREQEPALYGTVSVSIDPPTEETSRDPNFYLVSWVTDDEDFAAWLKDDTGLAERVRVVNGLTTSWADPDLLGDAVPEGDLDYRFLSPHPSPTPFELEGTVLEPAAGTSVTAHYWRETRIGTVRITTSHHPANDGRFGVSRGEASALGPGTSRLFGGASSVPFQGLTSAFSTARWEKVVG